MAKSMHEINLLPNRENILLIQFLRWSLTIGRLLIILVETLALGTFLYRFSLDMQISDLNDDIKQQRVFATNFKEQEDKFRNLQVRLDLSKKIDAMGENNPKILSDIIEMGRGYITFKNISISTNAIQIEAQASTIGPLRIFINTIKKYPQFESVSIDKVENKTESAVIIISINVNLKQSYQPVMLGEDKLQENDSFNKEKLAQ